jgi:hypothetical protein
VCPIDCPTYLQGFNNKLDKKSWSFVAASWNLLGSNSKQLSPLDRMLTGMKTHFFNNTSLT